MSELPQRLEPPLLASDAGGLNPCPDVCLLEEL
jgi:hypothetical protein